MATSNNRRTSLPAHRRVFGMDQVALDAETPSAARRVLGRLSLGGERRPSFISRWRTAPDLENSTPTSERPPIPTMMQTSAEVDSTPLHKLSMIVLSITMLGEFLSANVSTPFLLFMVKGFGKLNDEAEVAFWTGVLVSTFFMTQFLTSLLWATVADRHGRRIVLIVSLLGSAVTCLMFGTATTLPEAICIRLMQGVFAGAVGVARGSVAFITDATNEGRAYSILGFCWGLGGVVGAIIGGSFETPAAKWPQIFNDLPLFVNYPYLLPCSLAALITLIGSILACFLGPDGGPREGAIQLSPEKLDIPSTIPEESSPPSPVFDDEEPRSFQASLRKKISQKLSGYFPSRAPDSLGRSSLNPTTFQQPVPLSSGPALERTTTMSTTRTSRFNGSAYGYSGFRNRLASNATVNRARHGSMASSLRRRGDPNRESQVADSSDLNFAQRLLMANENAVTNIADLWVAAAMNVDNEDPFESDTETDSDAEPESALDDTDEGRPDDARGRLDSRNDILPPLNPSPRPRPHRLNSRHSHSQLGSPRRPSVAARPIPGRQNSFTQPLDGTPNSRRYSTREPSIFSHPGVKTPTAVLDAQMLLSRSEPEGPWTDSLTPIIEHRVAPPPVEADQESLLEKPPSLSSQIPVLIIIQYGLLALHTTTHDQIFMSYLVSPYEAGGLNLNAGHFAQLIALMCLVQIAYQFYLYPNIGPPRGRFSHLTMFRMGSLLFIPAYLSTVLYQPLASPGNDGNLILMSGMESSSRRSECSTNPLIFLLMIALAFSTALRYCGITFGYTAISILLNYMTPPAAVGFANGIAQSIVSLARCFGPVLGGYLWSVSTEGNPSGYPLGFIACAAACGFSVIQSFLIR
ncbi:hypothetical protein C8J56DRAFT_1157982 [Mycena floridula]|nr:hypothetical protein C8J56DRAFT_1157982 [Mycena floridula]